MKDGSKKAMEDMLVECGISRSRCEKINKEQLHDIIVGLAASSTQCFRKHFSHALGRSGGTLDCVCRHLVLYASKTLPFAESPKDAISVLLLLKHLPHAAFYDFWCGAADELVRSFLGAGVDLGPRAGALLKEDDVAKLSEHLPVSIPALKSQASPCFSISDSTPAANGVPALPELDVQRPPHPYTASKICLLCHDRLHGEAHEHCCARDPNNVTELLGLSTESAEHFNSLRTRHDRFLRNESAQRNLFLHKVIAYLRNRDINLKHLERLRKELQEKISAFPQFSWKLAVSEFGQVQIQRSPIAV